MNNKPKLRFKEFYQDWQEWKLEDKGTLLKGKNLGKDDLSSEGYPCILYGELYTKYSELTNNIYSKTNKNSKDLVMGKVNDVLIPSSGETAIDISTATCLLSDNVLLGGDLNVYRSSVVDGKFLSYLLNHKQRFNIAKIAQGATVVHLYSSALKKLKVVTPTIEEQQKIAEFLSKVDEIIAEREAEVKDYEQQKKGLMQKLFSQQIRFTDSNNNPYPDWEEVNISNLGEIVTGNTPKTEDKSNYGDEYLFCSPADLGTTKYIKSTQKMLSSKGFNCTRKLPYNSVLVTCIGSTIGKIGISSCDLATNQQINSIIPNNNDSNFIYYALVFSFPRYVSVIATQAVPIINKTEFGKLKLRVPCLEEQQKIANVLSKLDELIEEKKALLSDWQQFKKGLLQQMFV